MNKCLLVIISTLLCINAISQGITYPHTQQFLTLQIEGKPVTMRYMDVRPTKESKGAVLLLHGKNFSGYYWKDVIQFLTTAGYRVIAPDQVGFGRSDKPHIHYSFHRLAANTKALLDTLGISNVHVIGHSMGGMLATRFALLYPLAVKKLILENPIGLEDYRTFIPYRTLEQQFENEQKATYESYKKYQQTYYPVWKPEYEQYVAAQAETLQYPDTATTAWANARTYLMIYEQPVVYEFKNITHPTLLIMGQEDRTVVGKNLLPDSVGKTKGQYPVLSKWLQKEIKGSKLVALKGVGHIPHVQVPEVFKNEVIRFLNGPLP